MKITNYIPFGTVVYVESEDGWYITYTGDSSTRIGPFATPFQAISYQCTPQERYCAEL
jgi:hypothetical protein